MLGSTLSGTLTTKEREFFLFSFSLSFVSAGSREETAVNPALTAFLATPPL